MSVKKEVAAINTGNIAAFVRQSIEGNFVFTKEVASETSAYSESNVTVPDDAIVLNNLNEKEYVSIEAGSYLVYAPDGVDVGGVEINYSDNGNITKFEPTKTGLYLFRKLISSEKTTDDNDEEIIKETYTYTGYYYVAAEAAVEADEENGVEAKDAVPAKFYKIAIDEDTMAALNSVIKSNDGQTTNYDGILDTENDGFVGAMEGIKFVTEQKVEVGLNSESNLTYKFEEESYGYDDTKSYADDNHPARVVIDYNYDGCGVEIYVNLDNIVEDDTKDGWILVPTVTDGGTITKQPTFYYTSVLGKGETSKQLITSITLGTNTEASSTYKGFDFDLNVKVESVQAVQEDKEKEIYGTAAVASEWANDVEDPGDNDGLVDLTTYGIEWKAAE